MLEHNALGFWQLLSPKLMQCTGWVCEQSQDTWSVLCRGWVYEQSQDMWSVFNFICGIVTYDDRLNKKNLLSKEKDVDFKCKQF